MKWYKAALKILSFSLGADSPRSSEPLPLAVAKQAKVSDMEDDQLGEEDLVFLDDKWVSNFHYIVPAYVVYSMSNVYSGHKYEQ